MKDLIIKLLTSLVTEELIQKLLGDALDTLFEWLEAKVKETDNTLDDAAVAGLKSVLRPGT